MIVTLTGENGFGLRQALRQLMDDFTAKHGDLALERLDGEQDSIDRIREAFTGTPFLAERKLVILRGLGASKQLQENIEQLCNNLPDTTDVIFVEPKPDKRLNYYKLLKRVTDLREFPPLDREGLARWLAAEAKVRGGSLSPGDARYLAERTGAGQQQLSGELDKLLLNNPSVSRRTIDELTEANPQSTIFQLLESAFAGNGRQALKLYAEQRAQNVEPVQIIAMLAWQLHVLAVLKTAGDRPADAIAREARLNPFVVRKSQAVARRLSLARLKSLLNDLLQIDIQSKSTSIDADEALQHYLLRLASA
jgi:DNA polymerase-3 subunit delta